MPNEYDAFSAGTRQVPFQIPYPEMDTTRYMSSTDLATNSGSIVSLGSSISFMCALRPGSVKYSQKNASLLSETLKLPAPIVEDT